MTKRMSSLVSVSAIAMAVAMAQPAYSQVKLQFGSETQTGYVVKQGSNADVRDAREDGRDDIRDAVPSLLRQHIGNPIVARRAAEREGGASLARDSVSLHSA